MAKDIIYVDPKQVHVEHQTDAPVIAVKLNELGFYPIYTQASPADLNGAEVAPEIVESAIIGSMFGWNVLGAQAARAFMESNNLRSDLQ